jgi:GT2 family glycosyltransferase
MSLITGSLVLYNSDRAEVSKAIESFIKNVKDFKLFLVDNSANQSLKSLVELDCKLEYIHNPSNPGFGASHNLAMQSAQSIGSKYHFIINPDTYFIEDVVSSMIDYMENNTMVGMMMPEILNVDGSPQYLPKLIPSFFWVLRRKLKRYDPWHDKFIQKYELRNTPQNLIYNTPIISGCFTLLKMDAIKDVGGYDDRFFMYFEDWDLSRRISRIYKTVYFPSVSIYHGYASGANKNSKLFRVFIQSAIIYFNKWGWFFDRNRIVMNKKTLDQF